MQAPPQTPSRCSGGPARMTWALARRQDEAEAKRFGLFSYGVAVLARFPPPDVSFGIPAFPSSDVSFVHLCSGLCTFHSHGTAPGEPSPVRVRDRRWVSWMKGFLGALSLESICSDFPAGGLSPPFLVYLHREAERQRGGGMFRKARDGRQCAMARPHLRVPSHVPRDHVYFKTI